MAATKLPFVQKPQERVENCAGTLKDFVEKGNLGFRKHAADFGFNDTFFELAQIDGPKDFIGLSEPPEQIFKVSPTNYVCDTVDRNTLCSTGGTDYEQMLACHRSQDDKFDKRIAFNQSRRGVRNGLPEVRSDGLELLVR